MTCLDKQATEQQFRTGRVTNIYPRERSQFSLARHPLHPLHDHTSNTNIDGIALVFLSH